LKVNRLLAGTLALVLVAGLVQFSTMNAFASSEFIINGDFETGDFTGWTLTNSGFGFGFQINDGTPDPSGPSGPIAPISGNFDAYSSQTGPGSNMMCEAMLVPSGITSATLSWNDRIQNRATVFSDPNQEYRVEITDAGGTPIQEIFSTNPGDPLIQLGPNNRSFDVTLLLQSLEGQNIRLKITQQDDLQFFNVNIDDISLIIETGPVGGEFLSIDSTALVLAGLQTSAIWMLPVLAGAAGVGIAAFKLRRK